MESASGKFAFVYKAALSRNAKTEAEYFPTLYVIPSATKTSGSSDAQLVAYGFSLAMEALRKIDPEIGRMLVAPIGEPRFEIYHDPGDLEPALRKNGRMDGPHRVESVTCKNPFRSLNPPNRVS